MERTGFGPGSGGLLEAGSRASACRRPRSARVGAGSPHRRRIRGRGFVAGGTHGRHGGSQHGGL